jgi:hypothetical protein
MFKLGRVLNWVSLEATSWPCVVKRPARQTFGTSLAPRAGCRDWTSGIFAFCKFITEHISIESVENHKSKWHQKTIKRKAKEQIRSIIEYDRLKYFDRCHYPWSFRSAVKQSRRILWLKLIIATSTVLHLKIRPKLRCRGLKCWSNSWGGLFLHKTPLFIRGLWPGTSLNEEA